MVLSVWLVAYHVVSRRRSPAHWAIYVTSGDDTTRGDIYHAIGDPFRGFRPEVKLGYSLASTSRRYTLIFLGYIDEGWDQYLAQIAESIGVIGASRTPLDPFAGQNCQNWAVAFIQALIDQNIIDESAMTALEEAPVE